MLACAVGKTEDDICTLESRYNITWYTMALGYTVEHPYNTTYFMLYCTQSDNDKSMGWYKKDVTQLLKHWSYVFLALTHRNARDRSYMSSPACVIILEKSDRVLLLFSTGCFLPIFQGSLTGPCKQWRSSCNIDIWKFFSKQKFGDFLNTTIHVSVSFLSVFCALFEDC